jgi:hypothetical protein
MHFDICSNSLTEPASDCGTHHVANNRETHVGSQWYNACHTTNLYSNLAASNQWNHARYTANLCSNLAASDN